MSAEEKSNKNSYSLDWLVGGVLTKIGDMFDQFTGRNWNPSSSLATSKLVEKLKILLDSEIRDLGDEGKFVPHIIKLKIQWNKFSTESEEELVKLEHELHAATIDRINDKLYHTYAPLDIEIKADYFTEGVRMLASYGKFADKNDEESEINVTLPDLRTENLIKDNKITVNLSEDKITTKPKRDIFIAEFNLNGQSKEVELNFSEKKRISVGRLKENDLSIPDQSVSKVHASLVFSSENQLLVADTGSTNGTFVNGERIAYGKASPIDNGAKVKFGTIEVEFQKVENFDDLQENLEMAEQLPAQVVIHYSNNNKKSFDEAEKNEDKKDENSQKIKMDKTQD